MFSPYACTLPPPKAGIWATPLPRLLPVDLALFHSNGGQGFVCFAAGNLCFPHLLLQIRKRYIKIENFRTEKFRQKSFGQKTFGRFFRNFGQKQFRTNTTLKSKHDTKKMIKLFVILSYISIYNRYVMIITSTRAFECNFRWTEQR